MVTTARYAGLIERVANALQQAAGNFGLNLHQHAVVIGVSGGPDSVALLHILTHILPAENLVVAHLDHGLRPTSAAEANHVAEMAKDVRFHTRRVDVSRLAKEHKLTVEEAGRLARYEFLADVGQREGTSYIVVGHHADDQIETVLMHFLRGSGTTGLRGMAPASALPGHPGFWLLRPMLDITRSEIEQYCAENNLGLIHDESNADQSYTRNRLRHELLPELERYNPQIRQRLLEMAAIISGDDDLLAHLSEEVWPDVIDRHGRGAIYIRHNVWNTCPLALRRRLLRRAITELDPAVRDVGFRSLEAARLVAEKGVAGTEATLPGGLTLRVSYDRVIIAAGTADLTSGYPQTSAEEPARLPVPGAVKLSNGWRIEAEHIETIDKEAIRATSDKWTVYITDKIAGELQVRTRKKGECMRPLGLDGETSLKEIMIDRKIPAYLRGRWPVVTTSDHIVWLPGHVLDTRAKVPTGGSAVRLRCLAGA